MFEICGMYIAIVSVKLCFEYFYYTPNQKQSMLIISVICNRYLAYLDCYYIHNTKSFLIREVYPKQCNSALLPI